MPAGRYGAGFPIDDGDAIVDLLKSIGIEPGGQSRWTGMAVLGGQGVAFGGQMAAQALVAAGSVEPDRLPSSIHSFFLSHVRIEEPVEHEVNVLRAGRAFTLARVETRQDGRHCLSSLVTLHNGEAAPEHQAAMPAVAPPDGCPPFDFIPSHTNPDVRRCFEIRLAETSVWTDPGDHPRQSVWLRYPGALGDDPASHCAALVWFSDLSMPWIADMPYDESHGRRFGASLDHTVWFHRPLRADQWLLFVQESPVYAGARAMSRGLFYAQDGTLVASAAQETLFRRVR